MYSIVVFGPLEQWEEAKKQMQRDNSQGSDHRMPVDVDSDEAHGVTLLW